ncbi:MAG TPA: ATP-binding cassette domain-containing protein [Pseudomonadales bacterium]|nr:ATP-binding cassette domain-containing protein [Pseudomonadales bacterium]
MSLALEDVTLMRGARTLLTRQSLALAPGMRIALCGPNGAGKSSLLGLLAGDLRPSRGRVLIDGRAPRHWGAAELARHRAVLVQQTELMHPFRMEQVVGLAAAPGADLDPAPILAELGIDDLRGRLYTQLSGGEQRLVQLARVLAQLDASTVEPGWLLLDEPASHLDLGMTARVLAAATRRAARGHGVIAVLHDLELASRWAQRMLVLHDGALIGDGAPRTVLDEGLVETAWQVRARVLDDPEGGVRIRLREDGDERNPATDEEAPEASS